MQFVSTLTTTDFLKSQHKNYKKELPGQNSNQTSQTEKRKSLFTSLSTNHPSTHTSSTRKHDWKE